MKTEFDKLVRSAFDEGEFPYNPTNWEQLVDRMDGNKGKRKRILWIPLTAIASITSIAASLAMIITIPVLMHQEPQDVKLAVNKSQPAHTNTANITETETNETVAPAPAQNNNNAAAPAVAYVMTNKDGGLSIHSSDKQGTAFDTKTDGKVASNVPQSGTPNSDILKEGASPYYTFEPDDQGQRKPRTTISISGGYLAGSNKGYVIATTAKRNITDRLYVESDLAFVSNSGTDKVTTFTPVAARHIAAKHAYAKTVSSASSDVNVNTTDNFTTETQDKAYNLSYAQFTPSIGYNVLRNVSVGVGADMQQLLQNDKPVMPAEQTHENIKEVAGFDVGFIAKTECKVSKKLKAGVYYRQGMNNVISTYNKYIDRNYVQIQLKYTLFNR